MNQSHFAKVVYKLGETSGSKKKRQIIRDEIGYHEQAIALLAGQRFDDAGIGKKTVKKLADVNFSQYPTPTEALRPVAKDRNNVKTTVEELYEDCEKLSEMSGNSQKNYLRNMLWTNRPDMVAFVLLNGKRGSYSTGASEKRIAKAFLEDSDHDPTRALAFNPDVATLVKKYEAGNLVSGPVAGQKFKPMLAKNKDIPEDTENWVGQRKEDGYRLLIHVTDAAVFGYTRRMNNVTNSLPELHEVEWPSGTWIFDCEVIAEDGSYKSTSERVGAKDFDRELDMHFKLFDVVLADGEDVTQETYQSRYEVLQEKAPDHEYVDVLPVYENLAEAKAECQDSEGIIAKRWDSPYKAGKRSSHWRKDKNTAETVDVVVNGFVEGEGSHHGTLGKITVETADGTSVGGVGTGFTDGERDEIWNNRDDFRGKVAEVRAEAFDEALRFPSFIRWRDDDGTADKLERIENILEEA